MKKDSALIKQLLLYGLAGLLVFVQNESKPNLLTKWDPSGQNKFVHDSAFIGAFFSTPKKQRTDNDGPSYSAKKRQVSSLFQVYIFGRSNVTRHGRSVVTRRRRRRRHFRAVARVFVALLSKGIAGRLSSSMIDQLKALCGELK
jgi:hypothetical protein